MKKYAFGAIDLLLALVVTSIIFITMIPTMKNISSIGGKGDTLNTKSVQQQVDEQVNQIQAAKDKINQEQMEVNKENQ